MSARDGDSLEFLKTPLTRRQVLKAAALVGAGAAMGPVVAACGGSSSSSASPAASGSAAAKSGGELRVAAAAGSAKENLDIHAPALTMPSMDMRFNLYDSLLEHDAQVVLGMALAEFEKLGRGSVET